jgi:RNA polymerase sigma-70 factor (ECF subfamily)
VALQPAAVGAPELKSEVPEPERLERVLRADVPYIWRLCRRLGLSEGDADDAVQQVCLVAARRLGPVRQGGERPFLYGVAVRVVAKWRRQHAQRREDLDTELERHAASLPNPEELCDRRSERLLLDALLDSMPDDLRVVLVLHEIEQQTAPQIAEALDIPVGTAVSRLRRAREDFAARVSRYQAKRRFEGEGR